MRVMVLLLVTSADTLVLDVLEVLVVMLAVPAGLKESR